MNEDSEKVIKTDKVVNRDKKAKRGIIYLSTIPKYMNVTMIREIFSAYGEVDRVYLQLDESKLVSRYKCYMSVFFFFYTYIVRIYFI